MILNLEHWYLGYQQIQTDCQVSEDGVRGTCWLLCNADVDAMASARILTYMLRSDGIPYQLIPCTNYTSLEQHLTSGKNDNDDDEDAMDNVKSIVLLNFGASRNLTKLFQPRFLKAEETKVYVMDCRRPVHLANIHAGENVVIFMDETQGDEIPSDGDNLSGNESTSEEEEEDDDDDDDSDSDSDDDSLDSEEEADFADVVGTGTQGISKDRPTLSDNDDDEQYDGEDEGDEGRQSRRKRDDDPLSGESDDHSPTDSKKQKTNQESIDPIENDNDEDSLGGEPQTETNSSQQPKQISDAETDEAPVLSPRELHRQRRERLRVYYSSGSFFGSPAAYVAYRLASGLRFGEQPDLLWLACVGVTDAYLHARLDGAGYTTLAMDLRESCRKLFPKDSVNRAINTVYAEDLSTQTSQDRTKISFSDNGRIVSERDYRFFLLRHSSLFDSMVHSDYMSTKMQVWTKQGMHKLQELLAKMGYPLEECQQPFAFMKPSLRRRLHDKIVEHAEDYGLEGFEFTSFFRVTGYQSLLSASDTSYAVTALLECDTPATSSVNDVHFSEEAFNNAYDSLSTNTMPTIGLNGLATEGNTAGGLVNGGSLAGNTGLAAGIRLAKSMQRSIISAAVSLVDRNAITRLRHFRYAYLTCTSAGQNQTSRADVVVQDNSRNSKDDSTTHHIFSKPLALTRLAHYLMNMHRENGKWAGTKARPLVLLAEKPSTQTYMVVGYEYPERAGSFVKNKFGMNFELAAKTMNGTFKFDSFDSNVVEVAGSDVQRFVEQLYYLMDSI